MGANIKHLDDETMAYSLDASSEPTASPEEVVSTLRDLGEALRRVHNLASEENSTVEAFLERLQSMSLPISLIPIDTSLLPDRFGPVGDARINAEGVLIITSPDGSIETVNLTSFDNRDLFLSVLEDIVEKLMKIANRAQALPEVPCDELDFEMAVIDIPVIKEPQEIGEVTEPEPPKELSFQVDKIDEPGEEQLFVEPESAEPLIDVFAPPPEPIEYEPYPVPPIKKLIFIPNVQSYSVLRRFRDKVLQERGETSRSISEIRRLREKQVQKMRTGTKESWIREETGVFTSLKKLLSRKFSK